MALSDWTVVKQGSHSVSIVNTGSITGSSLLVRSNAQSGDVLIGKTSGAGVSTGRIRTVLRSLTNNAINAAGGGLFCMMQTSISTTSQSYWLVINTGAATTLHLKRNVAANMSHATNGNLTTATIPFSLSDSRTYALDLKWQYDSATTFMTLTGSFGILPTYGDMTQYISYTDSSGQLTSGVSAGVAWRFDNSSQGDVMFDNTDVYVV